MTEEEKKAFLGMLKRKQVGWNYLESERRIAMQNVVTKDVISEFDSAFAYSQTQDPRMDSGLVQFYIKMQKAPRQ